MYLQSIKVPTNINQLSKEQLLELQTKLKRLGYYNEVIDGLIGPNTIAAWASFKKDRHQADPLLIGPASVSMLVPINWNDNEQMISYFFKVRDVTKGDIARKPLNINIENRIIRLARELDKIRLEWGNGIEVTSWYRPPAINRAVGGAGNSQHIQGCAVDIIAIGEDIYKFQKWLDEGWYGALGYGAPRFVHIDQRNGGGWRTGSNKGVRWHY
jgi:putative chitinase